MQHAPFGTWTSPLSAAGVAGASRRIGDLASDGGDLYWGESRPEEGGRVTIMRRGADGTLVELLAAPYSARTRVHEYGGGAFTTADGTIYFSNFSDQRLYRMRTGGTPDPLTAEGSWRYADAAHDRQRRHLICVREDHTRPGTEPKNEIVAVDCETGATIVLVSGADFYASPRVSPDGRQLCWLEWSHPDMPWDGTRLCVADIAVDGLGDASTVVAGGREEAVYCPQWSPRGILHFVSDRTGWWNLYRIHRRKVEPLWRAQTEFGLPLWTLGSTTYGFDGENVVCIFGKPGAKQLARIPAGHGKPQRYELPYSELGSILVTEGRALLTAASPSTPQTLIEVDLATGASRPLHQPSAATLDAAFVSTPQHVSFPTPRGNVHAFYYAPKNPGFSGLDGEKPPLIVISHGGPTGSTSTAFSSQIQFWTTRGFAVLDVNYGGSTGYGRAYRERLTGQWGIVDVEGCVSGARYLADRGVVDGNRLLIRGGSAGGYTTLCALAFHDVFRAGASHYGIGDLEALAKDTHKFESRYLDKLIGPYPASKATYVARSPIHHVDRLSCPIIFFQGLEDRVVPPAQAEAMSAALRAKGVPVSYVPFAGEQHGFRRAENIVRALEAELYFYGRVLGFAPADRIEPVPIANLP